MKSTYQIGKSPFVPIPHFTTWICTPQPKPIADLSEFKPVKVA